MYRHMCQVLFDGGSNSCRLIVFCRPEMFYQEPYILFRLENWETSASSLQKHIAWNNFELMIYSFIVLWWARWFIPDKNIRHWSLTWLLALRSPALLQRVCTVSWLRSYEFGQSEECEPSHGPQPASERESSLKFRAGEEWICGATEYDTVRLLQGSHPLSSRRT